MPFMNLVYTVAYVRPLQAIKLDFFSGETITKYDFKNHTIHISPLSSRILQNRA